MALSAIRRAPQLGQNIAALATEGNQVLVLTLFTAYTQKTVSQAATLEKGIELILHITRQRPALRFHRRQEIRGVLFDDLIEKGLFRPVAVKS